MEWICFDKPKILEPRSCLHKMNNDHGLAREGEHIRIVHNSYKLTEHCMF